MFPDLLDHRFGGSDGPTPLDPADRRWPLTTGSGEKSLQFGAQRLPVDHLDRLLVHVLGQECLGTFRGDYPPMFIEVVTRVVVGIEG